METDKEKRQRLARKRKSARLALRRVQRSDQNVKKSRTKKVEKDKKADKIKREKERRRTAKRKLTQQRKTATTQLDSLQERIRKLQIQVETVRERFNHAVDRENGKQVHLVEQNTWMRKDLPVDAKQVKHL